MCDNESERRPFRSNRGEVAESGCCCESPRMERFLQPCLLLLLYENGAHGYELIERLGELGFEDNPPDPGAVYRNLRRMEQDGLVESKWETSGVGPARRLYRLTPEGIELLHGWAVGIRRYKKRLEAFLSRYDSFFEGGTNEAI